MAMRRAGTRFGSVHIWNNPIKVSSPQKRESSQKVRLGQSWIRFRGDDKNEADIDDKSGTMTC
jgi:hypothetical protein